MYKKAAEKGHTESQYEYARILLYGDKTLKNETEGLKWGRKAAEAGHIKAQHMLGACLMAGGERTIKNREEAIFWYKKAAEAGYVDAQYNLATAYEFGFGVNVDKEEAIKWYQKAASQEGMMARQVQKRLKKLTKKGLFS